MMYNIDTLTLLSGIDIIIPEIKVKIHQPTIREIAYIGERSFYTAASLFLLTKDNAYDQSKLTEEDKLLLSQQTDFDVFIQILNYQKEDYKTLMSNFLFLFLPESTISIEERFILITQNKDRPIIIDNNNFNIFRSVILQITCLSKESKKNEEFNPMGEKAKEIAEKIKRGRAKVAALQREKDVQDSSMLSKYISSLSVGMNSLYLHKVLDLTLFQLLDQLERYQLYNSYNIGLKAKLAGAKEVEEVDWLKDLH